MLTSCHLSFRHKSHTNTQPRWRLKRDDVKTQLALNKQNSAHTSWNLEVFLNSFLNLRSICNSEGTINSPRNAENNSNKWLMSLKASRVPSITFATEAMKKWKQAIPRQMPMTAALVMFIAAFMIAAVVTNYWPTTTFRTTHSQTVVIIRIPPHVFTGTSFFVVIMFLASVAIRVSGYYTTRKCIPILICQKAHGKHVEKFGYVIVLCSIVQSVWSAL